MHCAAPCAFPVYSALAASPHTHLAPPPCSGDCGITGPGSYSPKADLSKLRSASFSFGQRTALRDPRAGLPGPGQYNHE